MRAMTWNVWWRFGGAWREREAAVLGVLADAPPDVLALVSRWPPLATRTVPLPATQRPGPPAHALVATLDHPAGPLHVLVAALEWEPRHDEDRMAQAWALADLAADADLPVLVLGDLNAAPTGPQLAALTRQLTDLWPVGGGDPRAVTLSSRVPEAPLEVTGLMDQRIDHVLARPGRPGGVVRASGARLAGDQPVAGRFPSDHVAVVVDVELTS